MKLSHIFIGVLGIILFILAGAFLYVLVATPSPNELAANSSSFSIQGFGSAGAFGYATVKYSGKGNLTLIAYQGEPSKTVYVIDDPQAIDSTHMSDLVKELTDGLGPYGYRIILSNTTLVNDGINVIPAGAMPAYALYSLKELPSNDTVYNRTIILIGSKDLLLGNGIKKLSWYDDLTPDERRRLLVYNGTLDEYIAKDKANRTMVDDILMMRWARNSNATVNIAGNASRTYSITLGNSTHVRVIYNLGDARGVADSEPLIQSGQALVPSPPSAFAWEKSTLQYTLNTTNGTPVFTVLKDGKVMQMDTLQRVTDENVFIEMLHFNEPGDYILNVSDNSGVIASGILHVKDFQVSLKSHIGVSYTFLMTVDGAPLDNSEAYVSINNSTDKKKFFISSGLMTIGAKLNKGSNTFNIAYMGSTMPIPVENNEESFLSFYLTYGVPALALVLIVYVGARMTRTPTYRLRFGDSVTYVREEVHLKPDDAVETISQARKDMGLGKAPITQHEYVMSLKRHFTKGADVTEGNLEGLLKKLIDKHKIEHHREYYQIRGEGDVRANTLRRMIKEKLIENGISFREIGNKFVTKDYEIGLFGEKFARKAVIVVDDESEIARIMAKTDQSELAKIRIKQANGMLSFVPIDRLGESL